LREENEEIDGEFFRGFCGNGEFLGGGVQITCNIRSDYLNYECSWLTFQPINEAAVAPKIQSIIRGS
jgi:hypothetical protein